MRRPEYLSPSSMSKWALDPNAYYLRYLSDNRLPEEPQNQAMSVGSAFDAYVKSFLYERLFGKPSAPGNDPAFERERIFEDQVQAHNRTFAAQAGEHLFNSYRRLGCLDDLMLSLGRTKGKPRFEMDIRGVATHSHEGTVRKVPFRVKPDLCYVNEHDAVVVLDWKVNGYLSQGVSPTPGFVRARRDGKLPWAHEACKLSTYRGLEVNVAKGLEGYNEEWARQVAIGGWMFGCDVGSQFIVVVHQLTCRPGIGKPNVTVAEHVGFVSPGYQEMLFKVAVEMWDAISSDHVFRHLSKEDSLAMCQLLDQRKETLAAGPRGFVAPALDD